MTERARATRAPERFDGQAVTFDDRAGLPGEAPREVADAIIEIAGLEAHDAILEIGAGTGEIGRHLARRVRYLGIDRSSMMLDVFRGRVAERGAAPLDLAHADADDDWPVDDASLAAVFASRVIHLLAPDHLESELHRALRPGGALLVGRVERDPQSPRSRLRQQRQLVLREHGIQPRQAEKATAELLTELAARGAARIETRPVAAWKVTTSPEETMARWSTLTSMGGVELDEATRASILHDVRRWAERELGDLSAQTTSVERYTIGGLRLGRPDRSQLPDRDPAQP